MANLALGVLSTFSSAPLAVSPGLAFFYVGQLKNEVQTTIRWGLFAFHIELSKYTNEYLKSSFAVP